MALPITPQMLKLFEKTKILHLEVTDVCQAACLLCARETDLSFDKTQQNHLSMESILNVLDIGTIKNLNKMFMCGNYGDPAAGRYTMDIYNNFRIINPSITLGMNTNGAIRDPDWWKELGSILHRNEDYVVFSIDGLEDTNHLYRQNVVWSKLIENIKAFIAEGGRAHWDMLVYEHNKHQVEMCEMLAKQLGFKWFRAKVSKRSTKNIKWLQQPKEWNNPVVSAGAIECMAENEHSLYISAKGTLFRCCWLGFNEEWNINQFSAIKKAWNTNTCNVQCKKNCTTNNSTNTFYNQWQRTKELC